MEYLIKTYTNEGETVLDFTMGSVQSVAAKNHRSFIGIMTRITLTSETLMQINLMQGDCLERMKEIPDGS